MNLDVIIPEVGTRSDEILGLFIAFMVDVKNSGGPDYAWGTIKGYVSAVRDYHIDQTGADPTSRQRVRRMLSAARKFCKRQGRVKRKWPLTAAMLRKWKATLDFSLYEDKVKYAAALTSFFGMLRVSEFAKTTPVFRGLCVGNVRFAFKDKRLVRAAGPIPDYVTCHLEYSKGDVWRFGHTLKFFRSGTDLCAVSALWDIMRDDTRPRGEPLFMLPTRSGGRKPLTRYYVSKYIKEIAKLSGRAEDLFNTHSARAGGACALWAKKYSSQMIQLLGRWRSDCWKIYVTNSDEHLRDVTRDMSTAGEDCIEYATIQSELRVNERDWPLQVHPAALQFSIGRR